MDVGFYHCTRAEPLAVLPRLAAKAHQAGQRVLVHAVDDRLAEEVDERLWTYDQASFLPHGRAGDEHDTEQPILLSNNFARPNKAAVLMSMSGQLPPDDAGFDRVLYLFDGNDDDAVARARHHWKALTARDGMTLTYWAQDERGWKKRG
ncbi:MAG: DNA polymerase III subunit chi [Pacificimonas sp.]